MTPTEDWLNDSRTEQLRDELVAHQEEKVELRATIRRMAAEHEALRDDLESRIAAERRNWMDLEAEMLDAKEAAGRLRDEVARLTGDVERRDATIRNMHTLAEKRDEGVREALSRAMVVSTALRGAS